MSSETIKKIVSEWSSDNESQENVKENRNKQTYTRSILDQESTRLEKLQGFKFKENLKKICYLTGQEKW